MDNLCLDFPFIVHRRVLMVLSFCCFLLFCCYVLLLLFYRSGWRREGDFVCPPDFHPRTTISVLIPARNETNHIARCLDSVLANHYPGHLYEIIVIDDFSDDDTPVIARQMLSGKNGRVLELSDYVAAGERINAYKKKALAIAIGEAKGDLIVTTDADCIVPPGWLLYLAALYESRGARFIAAPVSFIKKNNRLLYYFQSLDFMTMQGITAASVNVTWVICATAQTWRLIKKLFLRWADMPALTTSHQVMICY